MSYEPPRHILLRRQTDAIDDKDLAFLEQALTIQLAEVSEAYGLAAPGVTMVKPDDHLPQTEAVAIDFVDNDGNPGSVAHHGWNEQARFAWSLVGVRETWSWTQAASHEALEYLVNLRLDRWVDGPMDADPTLAETIGRWAMEICDPVEEDGYDIPVTLFGESRNVRVSNWVYPTFWELDNFVGPWDKMVRLDDPFTLAPGGYALVERDGVIHELGASQSARHGKQARARPASRVALIRAAGVPGGP